MHEALAAFVEHAFEQFNLRRIEAYIDLSNGASTRTPARLSFVKEGHLSERWLANGKVSDTDIYRIFATQLAIHIISLYKR